LQNQFRSPCLSVLLLCASLTAALAQAPSALKGIRLIDQHGQVITASSLAHGPLLMNFIFASCAGVCPVQVRELAEVRRGLPDAVKRKVIFLSVSVDPENDKPATLATFAKHMGADMPGWHFATGEATQVKELLKRMGAMDPRKPNPQPNDHRTSLYLFDATGYPLMTYDGAPVDRARLIDELTRVAQMQPVAH
jgi:protein SCO1/2